MRILKISKNSFTVVLSLIFLCSSLYAEETSYVKSTQTYKTLKSKIDQLRVVDNHEHLDPEEFLLNEAPDFFDMVMKDYTGADARTIKDFSAHEKIFMDKSLKIEKRWAAFLPIYEGIKNTGFMRCLRLGIKKVHGIEITDASSIKRINASIKELYKPGLYKNVLFDLGKIDHVLVYQIYDHLEKYPFPKFFKVARYVDTAIIFNMPQDIYDLEKRYDFSIHTLEDLETIYRKFVDESIADGVVGFKSAAAYVRSLDYADYSRDNAEALLKKVLTFTKASWKQGQALTVKGGEELTNYCMHTMLRIIEEKGMPISFHSGLQFAGQNDIRWSDPQLLIPLFREYKNVNFDLFHGGYPYLYEFAELGKSWPNVYLNLCWLHTVSPEGARSLLSEILEVVPIHKIFAFGADTSIPESVIGHLEMAKENCAIVLAEKVLNGYFSLEEAISYARRIFRTNSMDFFNLE